MSYRLRKIWIGSSAKAGFWLGLFVGAIVSIILIGLQTLVVTSIISMLFGSMGHNIALQMGIMSGIITILFAPLIIGFSAFIGAVASIFLSVVYNVSAKIIGGFKFNLGSR